MVDADRRDLLVQTAGLLVTLVVAAVALGSDFAGPYALVAGLAIGLSVGNLRGTFGPIFDADRYVRERGRGRRALDAGISALGSGLLGAVAVSVVGPEPGLLAYAVGAGAAAFGSNVVFLAVTRRYTDPVRPTGQ